jgi:hypothetical protein
VGRAASLRVSPFYINIVTLTSVEVYPPSTTLQLRRTMPRPKRALSGVDSNIPAPQESSSGKRKKGTMETSSESAVPNAQSNKRDEINAAAPRFIAIARPNWDINSEARDKEVDEDDESETSDEEDTEAPETLRNQDKSVTDLDSPEWPWTMSSSALDKYYKLEKEAENRDQDIQDVYIYNDFTAYGINEVIDNWVR